MKALRLLCGAALVAAFLPLSLMMPAQATGACPKQAAGNTDLKGLSGTRQPVILIHGWTGDPMQDMRSKLEAMSSRTKRQYFLFDYEDHNTFWASDAHIAGCLASYIDEVSQLHRERGGNGQVYLVAHSMGGLAIRFALDPEYGSIEDLSVRVGGVVTVDTPHTGTGWGDSFVAGLKSFSTESGRWTARAGPLIQLWLPSPGAIAWVCLKGGPGTTWNGCAKPPAMPKSIRLMQVVGDVNVRRTLFGAEAYTIPFAGDGIVPSQSQWAGGPAETTVSCTVDAADLTGGGPVGIWLRLLADHITMNIFDASINPKILGAMFAWETSLAGLGRAGCSHLNMPTYERALKVVDDALTGQYKLNPIKNESPLTSKTPTADWAISPGRFGPITVGMTGKQLQKLGYAGPFKDADGSYCGIKWKSTDGFEQTGARLVFQPHSSPDVLSEISLVADGASRFRTDRGVKVGSTLAAVKAAYGSQLVRMDITYGEEYPVNAYVVFGSAGALTFMIGNNPSDTVFGIFATEGTNESTYGNPFLDGC